MAESDRPKNKRSDVWNHFEELVGQKKAKYLRCDREPLSYHGGTTNLRDHLKSQHPDIHKRHITQRNILDYAKRVRCSETRSKEITDLIVKMVSVDLRPLHTGEGVGFLELMAHVDPGYKVPSDMHISSLVCKRHEAAISQLRDLLAASQSSISLSTDLWTSIANEAYITVSGHFISSEWKMCSVVLTTCAFPVE